jgi:hypothetical protein
MIMGILVITGMETMDTISAMVMNISTVEGMATTIMATRDTTTTLEEGMVHGGNNRHNHSNDKNRVQKEISQVLCYKGNNKGHYANDCPEKKAKEGFKPNPFQKGHVNHVKLRKFRRNPML